MNQDEIVALKGEEVAAQVEMLKTQEAFGLLIEKLQGALTDIAAGPLGTIAGFFTSILGESTAIALVIGGLGFGKLIAGLPALIAGLKQMKKLAIASAVAEMFKAGGSLGPGAIPYAIAGTAALVGGIAYATSMDDGFIDGQGKVVSTPKGGIAFKSGYGKRVLSSPEGEIAFNDKDTIVAGTNLEQNMTTNNNGQSIQNSVTTNQPTQNSVINRPTTNSMVSNNQNTTQPAAPANNAMMEGELSAIKRVLENIATKEGTVSMNGTKFGTVTAMNTYQIQ